jgi:hypothetical protein
MMKDPNFLSSLFFVASTKTASRLETPMNAARCSIPHEHRETSLLFSNSTNFQYHSLTLNELEERFEITRERLTQIMEELRWLRPRGRSWILSTLNVKIGDMVLFPCLVYCKDKNQLVEGEHRWLPARNGYILIKFRWGLVVGKDYPSGRLHILPPYTFTGSSPEAKRKEMVVDGITGEQRSAMQDFLHVVTDKDNTVLDEPKCFGNGLQLNCRSVGNFEASKKSSYLSIHEQVVHENGIALQTRARVVSKEDLETLSQVVQALADSTKAGIKHAIGEWPDVIVAPSTPAFGSVATQGEPATSVKDSGAVLDSDQPFTSVSMQDKVEQPMSAAKSTSNKDTPTYGLVAPEPKAREEATLRKKASNNDAQTSTMSPPTGPATMFNKLQVKTTENGSQGGRQLRDAAPLSQKPVYQKPPSQKKPRNQYQDRKRPGDDERRDGRPSKRRRGHC